MIRLVRFTVLVLLGLGLSQGTAIASFHVMQIERVTAGVGSDTTAQAIQLRMRAANQNQVQLSKIIAYDAAGLNPVEIINIGSSVANGALGDRVLIATAGFSARTTPAAVADFTMTNPIPVSYLAAGSLTFVHDGGTVYWRMSWGGASYTGSATGSTLNDADGVYGPPVPGPLPVNGNAWVFTGTASALSTTNFADYALQASAPFTNNAGASFTPNVTSSIPGDGAQVRLGAAFPNPFRSGGTRIAFELSQPTNVTLQVIGYNGGVVRTLPAAYFEAGNHAFSWDGRDDQGRATSPGVYFLRIAGEHTVQSAKVVRVR